MPFTDLMKLIPLPFGVVALIVVGLVIVGTLSVIDRRDLTTTQSIGLLLLVWAIPIFGFVAAMGYLWFVLPRRR
jgi:hypothetical protein